MRVNMSRKLIAVNGKSCYTYLAYKTQNASRVFSTEAFLVTERVSFHMTCPHCITMGLFCYMLAETARPLFTTISSSTCAPQTATVLYSFPHTGHDAWSCDVPPLLGQSLFRAMKGILS